MIIDIVSRDISTPEEQSLAIDAVKNTILDIVLIVVIGYDHDTMFCFTLPLACLICFVVPVDSFLLISVDIGLCDGSFPNCVT